MSFPYSKPNFSDAHADFKKLKENSFKGLMSKGNWNYDCETPYKHKISKAYIKFDPTGLISSNYFQFDARISYAPNFHSPISSWYLPSNSEEVKIGYEPLPQFSSSAFKCLLEKFKAKNVFDASMAWGDRLNGALASNVKSYSGLSMIHQCFSGYEMQCDLAKTKVKFNFGNSEEYVHNKKCDFSFVDFQRAHISNTGIDNIWSKVRDGGVLCLYGVPEDMVTYAMTLDGAKYLGGIGYQTEKDNMICEPIWIFRKDL